MDLLAVQLKQGDHCTVKELAHRHGVSERTITRDLLLMRERGMPIDADRGRGGGVRLDRHWGIGRINLAYAEAVDLLISIEVAEKMNSPMFLANLGSIKRQLIASFSPEKRKRVDQLKSRILIGVTASTYVQASAMIAQKSVVQALHQAFIDREKLVIEYQKEGGMVSDRVIEPHYLLLKYPVWYVIAFDHLRDAPRNFRCDRILNAKLTGESFPLLPQQKFQHSLEEGHLLV